MQCGFLAGAASALLLTLSASAQAVPVTVIGPADYSGSSYYTYAYGDGYSTSPTGPVSLSTTATSINPALHPATAAATLDINAVPYPTLSASTKTTGTGYAAVAGAMTYQFRIEDTSGLYDPSNPIHVPTQFFYKGSASAPTTGGASAYFNIAGINFAESYNVVAGAAPSATHILATGQGGVLDPTFTGTSFDEHKLYSIVANTYYRIDLKVSATTSGDGTASSFLDPFFFIDPSFADKGNFHIVLSQGVSNIVPALAGTPVPGSLLLFGTAMLALGATGYQAKRNGTSAATV